MIEKIKINFKVPLTNYKDGKLFIVKSFLWDIYSFGYTAEAARKALQEELIFFETPNLKFLVEQKHTLLVITLPVIIYPEEDMYVAECPVLTVASQGKTKNDAEKMIREAVMLFLEGCYKKGTLNEILNKIIGE
jgi:predicted RNase H-like HicB family nuclease